MRRIVQFSVLHAFLALAAGGAAPIPFPQAGSDLRADPAATFGTLPNGLRYVVMPNHEPKNHASLRLLVLAGSFEETESQRGLAHFLEHMAFNGSTHYAPGTLTEKLKRLGAGAGAGANAGTSLDRTAYGLDLSLTDAAILGKLERLGLAPGADTNASASFDHTLYRLDLPDTDPATLADGLQILADFGGGLLLQPEVIDRERRSILTAKHDRDTAEYRAFVSQIGLIEAGTRVPGRLPIGLDSVIENSGRAALLDFYNTWYRPELMAVVVVGDIDGAAIEKQVAVAFAGLAPRGPQPPAVDLGAVSDAKGVKTLYHGDPGAPDTHVVIACAVPFTHEPDTAANRIKDLPRTLATAMLNRRFMGIWKKDSAPFIRISANSEEAFDLYRRSEIDVMCRADQWTAALGVADQELRRALVSGFRADELAKVSSDLRGDLEQAAAASSTRRSGVLADAIAESLVERSVFTSFADDLALIGPALGRISPDDCTASLRMAWRSPGRYVFVTGNAVIGGDANAVIASAYSTSLGASVAQDDTHPKSDWAYSEFGPRGVVASRKLVDDLDFTEITFANGARLNIKKTDFEADTIRVAARLGTGQLTEPGAAEPGLSAFSSLTFTAGGLGRHSAADLKRILAGRTVEAKFTSTLDAFILTGTTNRKDLALEFQLLAASIVDPGYRPEALIDARKRIDGEYVKLEHSVRGPLALQVPKLLFSNDPRFGLPPRDVMMARNFEEEKAWLAPTLASGALEVSIAGDLDIEAAIEDAARTIGALPERNAKPPLDELRKVSFPGKPFVRDYPVDTNGPKGLVAAYWPTSDGMDVHRARRLSVLSNVLSDRIRAKLREQPGGTYSPSVASSASDVFPGFGYIVAILEVDPAKAAEIEKMVIAVAGNLSAHGATEEELVRSKDPLVTSILETERTNRYWMTVLGQAQEKPEVLDWARNRRTDFESISMGDINALAKAYLAPEMASQVIIHPVAPPPLPNTKIVPPPDA